MRVYLVRHGQTEFNRRGIMQGTMNIPLNLFGTKQAHLCAKKLKDIEFDAIYTSDSDAALTTAKILASMQKDKDIDLYSHPLLKEIDLGDFAGLTWPQAIKLNPDINFENINNKKLAQIYRGESYNDVKERISYFFEWLYGFNYKNVLIITHSAVIKSMVSNILETKMENRGRFYLHNTGITIVEKNNDKDWKLVTLNDYSHLDSLRND